jgi:hypothetical protein
MDSEKKVTPTCFDMFWNTETKPPKILLIFNFKNFGQFQKLLIRPEIHDLNAIFCFIELTAMKLDNNLQIY